MSCDLLSLSIQGISCDLLSLSIQGMGCDLLSLSIQGMGYLHARGIIHKDLKTKNIFLENGKVVITDFGLFSVTKICHGNRYDISVFYICWLYFFLIF